MLCRNFRTADGAAAPRPRRAAVATAAPRLRSVAGVVAPAWTWVAAVVTMVMTVLPLIILARGLAARSDAWYCYQGRNSGRWPPLLTARPRLM